MIIHLWQPASISTLLATYKFSAFGAVRPPPLYVSHKVSWAGHPGILTSAEVYLTTHFGVFYIYF